VIIGDGTITESVGGYEDGLVRRTLHLSHPGSRTHTGGEESNEAGRNPCTGSSGRVEPASRGPAAAPKDAPG
jgi:hypothetical protein